jgi:NAD(P)-dependent dehydrogenase (short-subunit alcohol dehydrogenase family)
MSTPHFSGTDKSARTVFVVGGAGGIGLASARLLGAEGWKVVLGDISSVEHAFANVTGTHGLDCLINAAGVLQLGTILDVDEAAWERVMNINLTGVYRTCRAAVAHFVAQDGGSIVNLASQSGRTSSFYSAPNYVVSKAGIIGLTMVIAAQHAAQGIRANAVAPGLVETPMIASAYSDEQRAAMIAKTPIGRFASAEEVGEVVAFLASDRSSYVTGQTLNVNGGSFML